jgi:hypothetical protein
MHSDAKTPQDYIDSLAEDRKIPMIKLRNSILETLPEGFKEGMGYGMLGYSVPHSIYPQGYHCDPKLPLPFLGIASQKNFIALYHMGIYADPKLHKWFVTEFPKHAKSELDMGKSCIRFKKFDDIPYELITELTSKVSVSDWISRYENILKR